MRVRVRTGEDELEVLLHGGLVTLLQPVEGGVDLGGPPDLVKGRVRVRVSGQGWGWGWGWGRVWVRVRRSFRFRGRAHLAGGEAVLRDEHVDPLLLGKVERGVDGIEQDGAHGVLLVRVRGRVRLRLRA